MSIPEDNVMSLAVNDSAYLKTLMHPQDSREADPPPESGPAEEPESAEKK